MSAYIPIVSQDDEEPTMVVRPSVHSTVRFTLPVRPTTKPKPKRKQLNLFGKPISASKPKTVLVQAHTRNDGTRVSAHSRVIKSSKSAKAPTPRARKNNRNPTRPNKPANIFRAPIFNDMDPETAKLIKSMMIQDKFDRAKGNL